MQSCTVSAFPVFTGIKDIVIPVSNPITLYTRPSNTLVTLPLQTDASIYLSRDKVPLSNLDTDYMYNTYLPSSNVHGAPASMLGQPKDLSSPMDIQASPMLLSINPTFRTPLPVPTQDIRSDTQTQLNRS